MSFCLGLNVDEFLCMPHNNGQQTKTHHKKKLILSMLCSGELNINKTTLTIQTAFLKRTEC